MCFFAYTQYDLDSGCGDAFNFFLNISPYKFGFGWKRVGIFHTHFGRKTLGHVSGCTRWDIEQCRFNEPKQLQESIANFETLK